MARRYFQCEDCGNVFHLQHAKMRNALAEQATQCSVCGNIVEGSGSRRAPDDGAGGSRASEGIEAVRRGEDPAEVAERLLR